MTDHELEQKLAKALYHAAPDDLAGVLSRCEERKGTVIPMKKNQTSHMKRRMAAAACLALLLAGGGAGVVYHQAHAVASVISLDVNPSIQLDVNKNQKVLSCVGLNEDAREVLADMDGGADLEGTGMEVAVNALVGALVRHGYLDSISSAILISVEDENGQRAAQLEQQLTAAVDTALAQKSLSASVLSQTVEKDTDRADRAQASGISNGKAALVENILALNSTLDFNKLAALSVEELNDLLELGAPAMPIGQSAALVAALQYAGVTQDYQIDYEVDPELDDDPAHYEVELYHQVLGELEYKVDAWNGTILEGRKDAMTGVPANPDRISQKQAEDTALSHAGVKRSEASSVFSRFDLEDEGPVWEIEFYAGGMEYEYELDAYTGAVLDWDAETDDKGIIGGAEGVTAIATTDKITAADAENQALTHAGLQRSQVTELETEPDEENGRSVWEVEFKSGGMEYSYQIDALDGSVWKWEKERDD